MKKSLNDFSLSLERRIRTQAGHIFIGKRSFWALLFASTGTVDYVFVLYGDVEFLPWVSMATLILSFFFLYFVGSNSEKYRAKAVRQLLNNTQKDLVEQMKALNRKRGTLGDSSEIEATIRRLRHEENYFNVKFKAKQKAFN